MAFHGSPFTADVVNGRIEGSGTYAFANGQLYKGEFKDGKFNGKGVILFTNGGRFDALWEDGVARDGKFTFSDGLVFEETDWKYCTAKDRRFYSEIVGGMKAAGQSTRQEYQLRREELQQLLRTDAS